MNFFEWRKYRKAVRHLLQEARHARHMREDIADPALVEDLGRREAALADAWARRDRPALDSAMDGLAAGVEAVYPPRNLPWLRENVEILAVALAVAMAFRTYFIQPFKIPTGSMQPTLYGITARPQASHGVGDRFPLNLVPMVLLGEKYAEVRASVAGQVETRYGVDEDSKTVVFYIAGVPHRIHQGLTRYFSPGDYVVKGQVMASGRIKIGDHIFVDKIRYNFLRPKRGEIIVFSTDRISYPRIRPNSFYIKRLAALPGEEVAIDPPYLVINGEAIREPYPFKRLLEDRAQGYMGYTLPHRQPDAPVYLADSRETRRLGPDEYLPLGDNTAYSYDGRYFGPVTQESLVGPAFMVYWPLSRRFGGCR